MKTIIALTTLIALSGCASLNQSYSAAATAVIVGAQGAEDNNLKTLTVAICATPFSAIVRHPELVPGVGALCLPGGNLSNPANLLVTPK